MVMKHCGLLRLQVCPYRQMLACVPRAWGTAAPSSGKAQATSLSSPYFLVPSLSAQVLQVPSFTDGRREGTSPRDRWW